MRDPLVLIHYVQVRCNPKWGSIHYTCLLPRVRHSDLVQHAENFICPKGTAFSIQAQRSETISDLSYFNTRTSFSVFFLPRYLYIGTLDDRAKRFARSGRASCR